MVVPTPLMRSSPIFLNTPPTTDISTLSLHDALPIFEVRDEGPGLAPGEEDEVFERFRRGRSGVEGPDRKSTRLNSSHMSSSYAVFCLKKKKTTRRPTLMPHATQGLRGRGTAGYGWTA